VILQESGSWEDLPPGSTSRLKEKFALRVLEAELLYKTRNPPQKEVSSTTLFFEQMSAGVKTMLDSMGDGDEDFLGGRPQALPKLVIDEAYHRKQRARNHGESGPMLSPVTVTRRLIDWCVKQTERTRSFMEQNPDKHQPNDYRAFPGKLDHTTCLAFLP